MKQLNKERKKVRRNKKPSVMDMTLKVMLTMKKEKGSLNLMKLKERKSSHSEKMKEQIENSLNKLLRKLKQLLKLLTVTLILDR